MSARPRAQAILRAQLERAVPIAALRQPGHPLLTPRVEFAHALNRLVAVAKRVASSRGVLFKVGQSAGYEHLECSALGRELLQLLLKVVPVMRPIKSTMKAHPRLEGLIATASNSYDWNVAPWQLDTSIASNPRQWEAFLGHIVDSIRREADSRAFLSVERQEDDERKAWHRKLSAHFKLSKTAAARASSVVRLELLTTKEPSTLPWQAPRFDRLQANLATWLTDRTHAFETSIATWAWKIDFNADDGYLAHVLVLLSTDDEDEAVEIEQSLTSVWKSTAGPGSEAFSCDSVAQPVEYRGRADASWNDSLQDQLADAAIYFAWSDANIFVRGDHGQRLRGCGDLPDAGRRSDRKDSSPFPQWR